MSSYPMSPPPNQPMGQYTSASSDDVNQLSSRVSRLEMRFPETSWVFGPSFLKRAFAMWGHVIVAQIIVAVLVWIVLFACTIIFGGVLGGLLPGSR